MAVSTTEQRTQLVMSTATLNALSLCATTVPTGLVGAQAMLRALRHREDALAGRWRVPCEPLALDFIREQAPEIARLWPEVFGDVPVPGPATIIEIATEAPGQVVSGVMVIDGRVRLAFESGDALLIGSTVEIDWRPA